MLEVKCIDNSDTAELTHGNIYVVLGLIYHKDGSISVKIQNDLNLVDAYNMSRFIQI